MNNLKTGDWIKITDTIRDREGKCLIRKGTKYYITAYCDTLYVETSVWDRKPLKTFMITLGLEEGKNYEKLEAKMNIQPGDYVVLTGEKWGDESYSDTYKGCTLPRYSIQQTEMNGRLKIKNTIWNADEQDGWEVQRIQDYFEPGDEVKITYPFCKNPVYKTIKGWECDVLWFTSETWLDISDLINVVTKIHNLTKEGKMKETKTEKPTELTLKDLYITAKTPACEPTVQSFVAKFGTKVGIHNPELKKWIKERNLENDFRDNLPDHYAIIFKPEWQLKKNDYVFVEDKPNDIGRAYCIDDSITVIFHDDMKITYDKNKVKPITERPFQVGDWFCDIHNSIGEITTEAFAKHCNRFKDSYDLIISPAIPEVK